MRRKRVISVLLIGALTGTMFAGCGKKESVGSEEKEEKKEEVVVEFSYPPYGYDSELEGAFWEEAIAQFEEENPGTKIEMTMESFDNVFTKWEGYFTSGDTPDIGFCDSTDAVAYGLSGKAQAVTDVIDAIGGAEALTDDTTVCQKDGEWYCVPNTVASPVLAYRTDILDEAGFSEPPKNWEELSSMAKALTTDNMYGLGMHTSESFLAQQIYYGFIKAAGGRMLDENGKPVLNSEENLEALNYMVSLVKDGVVPPSSVDWNYGDDVTALATGTVAMDIMWGGFGSILENMYPDTCDKIEFTTMPVGPSGNSGSFSGAGGFFLFKDAKHPDEAKEFIKFIMSDEIAKKWAVASGNVSPIKAVAEDSELNNESWYKAVSDQSATATNLYADYGYVPGLEIVQTNKEFAKAFVNTMNGSDPKTELDNLQKRAEKVIADAENR